MVTLKELEHHLDNKIPLKIESEKCILCNMAVKWQPLLIKIPETVALCFKCSEKHPDNNIYKWDQWWWVYIIWEWFIEIPN